MRLAGMKDGELAVMVQEGHDGALEELVARHDGQARVAHIQPHHPQTFLHRLDRSLPRDDAHQLLDFGL